MINNGNNGIFVDNSIVNHGDGEQTLSTSRSQSVQRGEAGKDYMAMEGRVYSDLYRNTSEDMFIRTLMEGSIGMPAPTMEMLGFKNLSSNFREDSEELFKSWLTTGENQGHNSTTMVHSHPRQLSRRMLADQAILSSHQNGVSIERERSNENLIPQSSLAVGGSSSGVDEHSIRYVVVESVHLIELQDTKQISDISIRNVAERALQASNLYLAKAWFHSSQPMTRSRSSELRRRYVAMQNSQTAIGMEAMHNASRNGVRQLKQEFVNPNAFYNASLCDIPNQFDGFMPPSNSSSTFNTLQVGTVDKVSSVVSMLKGTLERKKHSNEVEKEAFEDSSVGYYGAQEVSGYSDLKHINEIHSQKVQGTLQNLSTAEIKDPGLFQTIQGSIDVDLENFVAPTNHIQMGIASGEPSQSESSAATPIISTGFDACDGPSNSGQTPSFCESSRNRVAIGKSVEYRKAEDAKEGMYDNLKQDLKKGSFIRYGSLISAASVDSGDPTKKRRVERSRKMAEAKERTQTPAASMDMQTLLKRCENLEKEVRSLKLNLAFMNRKDSEQTKQIEELQKQQEEMREEKERLLEEIERILSESDKM